MPSAPATIPPMLQPTWLAVGGGDGAAGVTGTAGFAVGGGVSIGGAAGGV